MEPTTRAGSPAVQEAAQIAVENPATGEIVGRVPALSPEEVAKLVDAGRAAQPGWRALGFEARARLLRRFRAWCLQSAEELIRTVMAETGKTWEDAQFSDLFYTCEALRYWPAHGPRHLADRRVRARTVFGKGRRLLVRCEPLGVVGVISPWNYPLGLALGDSIPALVAGNAVVLKPSELTPLSVLLAAEGMRECGMPEGIFQVATGGPTTGEALIDRVDMVAFTGSVATGKKVMARAAETLTPVSLELGGKDPLIVLEDAELERAANAAVYYSMANSGQTCISVERAYVVEPVYERFVSMVVERVRALRQGAPADGAGTVEVGAITAAPQLETIRRHVDDALARGARALTGGRGREGRGRFFEPTVLVDVTDDMACMREETFGPTLPIVRVQDADEAVRLANDSPYGLGATVFTRDARRGTEVARRVEAGNVAINDPQAYFAVLDLPMGGWKASGLGKRHGEPGIRRYCREQSILVARLSLKRGPHMFPYTRGGTLRFLRALRLLYGGRRWTR